VVLVGEDSLEANVGHLAALTGGEIFVADDADLAPVLEAAFASLRQARLAAKPIPGTAEHVVVARAGMTVAATWQPAARIAGDSESEPLERAVAALAASLALPALDPEAAAALAVAEGLVTHLTSLVLVDEASVMPAGIPGSRKIALPTPRAGVMRTFHIGGAAPAPVEAARAAAAIPGRLSGFMPEMRSLRAFSRRMASEAMSPPPPPPPSLRSAPRIDWARAPQELVAGDLSGLDPQTASAIRDVAKTEAVCKLAAELGLDPVVLVIALLARTETNYSARRIARTILRDRVYDDAALDAVMSAVQA
jgi:hypothetical protein